MKALSAVQEGQELLPGLCARPHASQHAAGCGGTASLLHTTHHHAEMGRFHNNTDTARLQNLRDGQSDLLGQALLYLKTAGEHFRQTGKLREAEDATVRDVTDVHLPRRPGQHYCSSQHKRGVLPFR